MASQNALSSEAIDEDQRQYGGEQAADINVKLGSIPSLFSMRS
jgi:hypothetical protein